jgi:hypothetical protein
MGGSGGELVVNTFKYLKAQSSGINYSVFIKKVMNVYQPQKIYKNKDNNFLEIFAKTAPAELYGLAFPYEACTLLQPALLAPPQSGPLINLCKKCYSN